MRLTVERDEFADTLTWAARTIPARNQVPVLSGVVLDAQQDLTVSTFDYEISTQGTVSAQVDEPDRILVGGRLLAEITRNLPAAPITLESDGSRLTMTCGPAKFQFPLLDIEDYPALPDMPDATGQVEASLFADAVSRVAFAADPTSVVAPLKAICVEVKDGELVMATTDRYRLATRWMDWRGSGEDMRVLPHAHHLSGAAKALANAGELSIGLAPEMLGISSARRQVTMRAVDGVFPDFRKLILPSGMTASFDITELVSAIKMIFPTVDYKEPVRLSYDVGRVIVEAGTTTSGSVEISCGYDGPEFLVQYRPRYLLDALAAIEGDTVTFGYASTDPGDWPRKPTRITGKDDRYEQAVMPVRLK